jgi:hypothetical protein
MNIVKKRLAVLLKKAEEEKRYKLNELQGVALDNALKEVLDNNDFSFLVIDAFNQNTEAKQEICSMLGITNIDNISFEEKISNGSTMKQTNLVIKVSDEVQNDIENVLLQQSGKYKAEIKQRMGKNKFVKLVSSAGGQFVRSMLHSSDEDFNKFVEDFATSYTKQIQKAKNKASKLLRAFYEEYRKNIDSATIEKISDYYGKTDFYFNEQGELC